MTNLTLQEWSAIAQVVLSAIRFVGIVLSIFLSVRTLREVQADRRQRQRPHLAFEGGGIRLLVEFVKAGSAIPGVVNPTPRGAGRHAWQWPQFMAAIGVNQHIYDLWQVANGHPGFPAFLAIDPTPGTTGIPRIIDKGLW